MKGAAKNRRRNKRARAVRRLQGVVEALKNQLKASHVKAGTLGELVEFHEDAHSTKDRVNKVDRGTRETQISNLATRVVTLERVPKFFRWFFGAA